MRWAIGQKEGGHYRYILGAYSRLYNNIQEHARVHFWRKKKFMTHNILNLI
jgi:hypothetical protein